MTKLHIVFTTLLSVQHCISLFHHSALNFWNFLSERKFTTFRACAKKTRGRPFWTPHNYWFCLIFYIPSMCVPIAECIYDQSAKLHHLRKFPFLYWACSDTLCRIFLLAQCVTMKEAKPARGWGEVGEEEGGISLSLPAWLY